MIKNRLITTLECNFLKLLDTLRYLTS